MKNSSGKLIAQAHSGSIKALWDISYRLSPENCSAEVLQLALKTLTAGVDRTTPPGDGVGVPCLTILGTTVQSGRTNPKFREIVIAELENATAADTICEWIDRCLYIALPLAYRGFIDTRAESIAGVQQNCILLDSLIGLDNRVYRAFLSSPRFAKLLIRVWVDEAGSIRELFIFIREGYQCPAYSVWHTTIDKEEGRETILKALLSDPRRAKQFAFAMVRRAKQARDSILGSSKVTPISVAQYFDALMEVLVILIPHSDYLRRRLVQANYLTEYSKVLYDITSKVSDSELKGDFRPIITTVAKLAKLVYEQQSRVLENWRDLIAGDFLPLITRIISVIPLHDDEYQNYAAYAILQNLGAFTVYPKVVKAMPSPEGMEMILNKADLRQNPELAKEWKIFCSGVITRATIDLHLNTFTPCDNTIVRIPHSFARRIAYLYLTSVSGSTCG